MRLLFVTAANKAFFPTLLVFLQSFAEQVGGDIPYVCDYGLDTTQREFLRRRGRLLQRAPALGSPRSPLWEKAMVIEYFQASGIDIADGDAVVWLDGDLTLVSCSRHDVEAVVAEMTPGNIEIAATPQSTVAAMLEVFRRQGPGVAAPFERLLAESGIEKTKTYYSAGMFFCRSRSFLERWSELSRTAADQPVLDENVFNAIIYSSGRSILPLDIDLWQAQGDTLDRLRIAPNAGGARGPVLIDGRVVKILHATSPTVRHLFIGQATFNAGDLVLEGAFKLLRPKPLLDLQLGILRRFLTTHRTELLELGLCRLAPTPVQGYTFTERASA